MASGPRRSRYRAEPLPTGSVTFAFTDIEGSTLRWERDRLAMQDAVRRHDAILREAIATGGGSVFKTVGDAFCSAFARPRDAVAAMAAAQRRLAAEDFSAVDGLRVRMALHTGTADERDNDYFGRAVNRVARLLALGHGGQILLSSAVAELVAGELPAETSLRDLGAHHLKSVADPEQVHQLVAPGIASEFPPLHVAATTEDLAIIDAQDVHAVAGFTGREDELAALQAALSSGGSVAVVHGLGGTGKSSLAREYAWRSREQYAVAWWLDAQTEDGIIDGLIRLGSRFIAGLDQVADRRVAAQRVIGSALGGFAKPVLLIFDNLEDERLLTVWRPRAGALTLLTSRNASWAAGTIAIALQSWPMESAIGYLQRESGRADLTGADARAIAETLGALPLAMAHAAASLRSMRMMTPARYLERINEHLKNAPRAAEYPRSVFATFRTAIAQAQKESPDAPAVLRLAAAFAPDGIPEELFAQPADRYPEILQPALADDLRLDAALGALDRVSLLTFASGSRTYAVHRLVQSASRESLGDDAVWCDAAVAVAEAAFPSDIDYTTWPQCERLLPHARAALDALAGNAASLPAARLADRGAVYFWKRAEYPTAERLQKRALAIREHALEADDPELARSLSNLGSVYREQGRYDEAKELHARALAMREKLLGRDHPDVAASLNNLGLIDYSQGRFAAAVTQHVRALAIWEKALGPDHPKVAHSLNTLAVAYHRLGRYDDATALYARSLAIREKAFGPEHPDVAESLGNLAEVYAERGRADTAEPLSARALEIWENAVGPDHPDVAYALNSLANVYRELGRYEAAEMLQMRALPIWERALGAEHPEVANTLNGLANVYHAQRRYDEAEALYMRALEIRERLLGPDHLDVASSAYDLARLHDDRGRTGEARPLYTRAAATRAKVLGYEHPASLAARERLELLE